MLKPFTRLPPKPIKLPSSNFSKGRKREGDKLAEMIEQRLAGH